MPNASSATHMLGQLDDLKLAAGAVDAAQDAKKAEQLAQELQRVQALQRLEQNKVAGKALDSVSEATSKSFKERAVDFFKRNGVEAVGGALATVAGMLIVNSVFNKKDDKEGGGGSGGADDDDGGSVADKVKSVMIVAFVLTIIAGIVYFYWKNRAGASNGTAGTNVTVQANFEPMPPIPMYYPPQAPRFAGNASLAS